MRVRILGLALGFCCVSALAQMGSSTSVTMQPGGDQNWNGTKAGGPFFDQRFVKKAMESSLSDVTMGRLALEKSTNERIKLFASQETEDHGKILDELKQAAREVNVGEPNGPSKSAVKNIDKMKALSGDAFDQAFLEEMAKSHKDQDKSYRDEARTTTSPQLKDLVTREDQMLEKHLQQAKELAETKGKM